MALDIKIARLDEPPSSLSPRLLQKSNGDAILSENSCCVEDFEISIYCILHSCSVILLFDQVTYCMTFSLLHCIVFSYCYTVVQDGLRIENNTLHFTSNEYKMHLYMYGVSILIVYAMTVILYIDIFINDNNIVIYGYNFKIKV